MFCEDLMKHNVSIEYLQWLFEEAKCYELLMLIKKPGKLDMIIILVF